MSIALAISRGDIQPTCSDQDRAMKKRRPRGRKREARRWLDELDVRTIPGPSMREASLERDRAFADLEVQDKALYDAVHQCISDEMERNAGLTFEEWRAQAARLGRRLHNLRALRQALRSGP